MSSLRFAICTLILLLGSAAAVAAQTLRGPITDELVVTPEEGALAEGVRLETITLIDLEGDSRFFDAIEIELTAPQVVSEFPGALSLIILGPISIEVDTEVATVVGPEILAQPLVRGGKTFYQISVRDDARPDASPAVTRVSDVVPPESFPIAVSIVTRMKGLSQAVQSSEYAISARSVVRDIGAITVRYPLEDGTFFDPEGGEVPAFSLYLDGEQTRIRGEYLLEPGLHRLRLSSDRFQDTEVTVGVERGRVSSVDLPLDLELATVSYTAPRGATVYVNGEVVGGSTGDFTVPPGEHTIVVVVGDYSVTRRFTVREQRDYSIAVTMDIAVEEIK